MKNSNLLYLALGGFMLMLLRSILVQNTVTYFCELIGLGGGFINFILIGVTTVLAFTGVIIFIIAAVKLIVNNMRKE